ncbi:hypothetical protein VVDAL79087_03996 [Vibrio vulnificus]|nr:hypothetical protein VVDAL79087_03996 [Vibrio vulnificus]
MEGSLEGLPEAQRLQQELKRRYGYHALSIRGSTGQAYRAWYARNSIYRLKGV